MSVRAKFNCWEKKSTPNNTTVTLFPVTDGSAEDQAFWAATPSGKIEIVINNQTAAAHFEIGKQYYVDFTEAPVPTE